MDTEYRFLCFPMQNQYSTKKFKTPYVTIHIQTWTTGLCRSSSIAMWYTHKHDCINSTETSANPGHPLQTALTAERPVHVIAPFYRQPNQ